MRCSKWCNHVTAGQSASAGWRVPLITGEFLYLPAWKSVRCGGLGTLNWGWCRLLAASLLQHVLQRRQNCGRNHLRSLHLASSRASYVRSKQKWSVKCGGCNPCLQGFGTWTELQYCHIVSLGQASLNLLNYIEMCIREIHWQQLRTEQDTLQRQ
jgi:hypothetical protein